MVWWWNNYRQYILILWSRDPDQFWSFIRNCEMIIFLQQWLSEGHVDFRFMWQGAGHVKGYLVLPHPGWQGGCVTWRVRRDGRWRQCSGSWGPWRYRHSVGVRLWQRRDALRAGLHPTLHLSHRVVFFDSCACSECPFCLSANQLLDSVIDLQFKVRY